MMLAPGWRKMMIGNRALAVQIAGGADVLHGVGHLGDIGQADGRAVVITDDERLVVVGVRDLVVGKDVRGHDAVGDLAFGQVGVLQAQHGLQIRQGKSVAGQLGGICVHAHGRQRAASDIDLPHALDLRQLLLR